MEILGGTGGVNGGGFVYTNLDTVSVGVVLKLPKLSAQQKRPEEIIADLAKIANLRVTSRTSVLGLKGKTTPEIARALGVEFVVEGSVVRDGQRLRELRRDGERRRDPEAPA